jgi:hypothetical protein
LEAAVTSGLSISADWEALSEGSPEERACFSALSISCHDKYLTEMLDAYVKRTRHNPLLSAYHLAEWMAWNWWRLRWEPRSTNARTANWAMAHRLSTIGHGYVWPNITMFSDGERSIIISEQTPERPETQFRYLCDFIGAIPSGQFESTIDSFIEQVRGQLREEGLAETNLDKIWHEVRNERANPILAFRRKVEALIGCDPDDGNEEEINRLISDSESLGKSCIEEMAAEFPLGKRLLTAENLRAVAEQDGYSGTTNVIHLDRSALPVRRGELPAWRIGADAAKALREQERLGEGPITNSILSELVGVQETAITDRKSGPDISFALETSADNCKFVLRSKWATGRRFDLARIAGDRLLFSSPSGHLYPATRSYTFRQKAQRSFAAELLSPFDQVYAMLDGDYSDENQREVAEHFNVSELTIRTMMVNHKKIEREDISDFLSAA